MSRILAPGMKLYFRRGKKASKGIAVSKAIVDSIGATIHFASWLKRREIKNNDRESGGATMRKCWRAGG